MLHDAAVERKHLFCELLPVKKFGIGVAVGNHALAKGVVGDDAGDGLGKGLWVIGRHIEAGGATGFFEA